MTYAGRPQKVSGAAKYRVSSNRLVDAAMKRLLGSRSALATRARSVIWGRDYLDSGTVSIVVPFFNVERYLNAALESIMLQRYRDLQVILVDDGSSDLSRGIAESFVARDHRFELLSTSGLGPGGARNRGLQAATGRYISFVDGDDVLPFGAIYRQVEALQESNVRFCVGAFERLDNTHRWRLPWVADQHSEYRPSVGLEAVPGITRNVFPWNKLFTRSFFDEHIGAFPEGTIYEDQVPSALAYTSGEQFTVLPETVYHWRTRESKDSITQNRSSIEHLEARIRVLREVEAIYACSEAKVYREWLKKTLFEDMRPFYEAAKHASDSYLALLRSTCTGLWEVLTPEERAEASPADVARTQAVLTGNYSHLFKMT